jgi:hypothetical protein
LLNTLRLYIEINTLLVKHGLPRNGKLLIWYRQVQRGQNPARKRRPNVMNYRPLEQQSWMKARPNLNPLQRTNRWLNQNRSPNPSRTKMGPLGVRKWCFCSPLAINDNADRSLNSEEKLRAQLQEQEVCRTLQIMTTNNWSWTSARSCQIQSAAKIYHWKRPSVEGTVLAGRRTDLCRPRLDKSLPSRISTWGREVFFRSMEGRARRSPWGRHGFR